MSAFQNKGDVQEKEVKKFDGAGYDKDLVEALEKDIISQNPNVKWYVSIRNAKSQNCLCTGSFIKQSSTYKNLESVVI